MILKLQMLNEDATLNAFHDIGSAQFVPNQSVKLVMRLLQTQRNLRYIPDAAATFSMDFLLSDDTVLTKVPTFLDAADRSLITVTLTALETALLIGQNLLVEVTEPGGVSSASLQSALQNASAETC